MSMTPPLSTRAVISLRGVAGVLRYPRYALVFIAMSALSLGLVLWSLNIGLLGYVLFEAPLSLLQKLGFLLDIYGSIATNYASGQAMTITLFSILFGLNITVLLYVSRRGQREVLRSKQSGGSMFFAVLGGGCAACGTALIGPLLGTFGASVSSAAIADIGIAALAFAIILTLYSLFGLGQKAATAQATQRQQERGAFSKDQTHEK